MNETGEHNQGSEEQSERKESSHVPFIPPYPDFLEGIDLKDTDKVIDVLSSESHSFTTLEQKQRAVIQLQNIFSETMTDKEREEKRSKAEQELYSQDPKEPGLILKLREALQDNKPFYEIASVLADVADRAIRLDKSLQNIRGIVADIGLMSNGDMNVTREDALSFLILKHLVTREEELTPAFKKYIKKRGLNRKDGLAHGYQESIEDIDDIFESRNFRKQLKHETEQPEVTQLDGLKFDDVRRGDSFIFETRDDIYRVQIEGIRNIPLRGREKETSLIAKIEMVKEMKIEIIDAKIPRSDFHLEDLKDNVGGFVADIKRSQYAALGWEPSRIFRNISEVYRLPGDIK
ncbi:MAG: hypothetical protein AAB632_01635 [Patescibacteria group bacterium]